MTDLFDMAQQVEQMTLDQALEAQRQRAAATPVLQPQGRCLNPKCCDDFEQGDMRLFCNATCSIEYQQLTRNR